MGANQALAIYMKDIWANDNSNAEGRKNQVENGVRFAFYQQLQLRMF
jgi:hypothetical protein